MSTDKKKRGIFSIDFDYYNAADAESSFRIFLTTKEDDTILCLECSIREFGSMMVGNPVPCTYKINKENV